MGIQTKSAPRWVTGQAELLEQGENVLEIFWLCRYRLVAPHIFVSQIRGLHDINTAVMGVRQQTAQKQHSASKVSCSSCSQKLAFKNVSAHLLSI